MPGDHGAEADLGVIQIEALLPGPELPSIGQRNPAALISRVTGWPSGTKQ